MIILDYCSIGLPILYDEDTKEIVYKENRVLFDYIKRAYESGYDKVRLSHNLWFKKSSGLCEYGCLQLQEEKVQHLIKKVCKLLKK